MKDSKLTNENWGHFYLCQELDRYIELTKSEFEELHQQELIVIIDKNDKLECIMARKK